MADTLISGMAAAGALSLSDLIELEQGATPGVTPGTSGYALLSALKDLFGLALINEQTGTSYTLVLGDAGKFVDMNNAAANTCTVPANSTVAYPIGTRIFVREKGAGWTTIAAAGGVTISGLGSSMLVGARYARIELHKIATNTWFAKRVGAVYDDISFAASDESTALTASTSVAKLTCRATYAMRATEVRCSLQTAQTSGSIFTVNIKEGGTTIFSTKPTIDNTEKTSTTAATAAVFSDADIADDAELTAFVDQIGDGTAKGLKVSLYGLRAA
jgi:hypothetical protein